MNTQANKSVRGPVCGSGGGGNWRLIRLDPGTLIGKGKEVGLCADQTEEKLRQHDDISCLRPKDCDLERRDESIAHRAVAYSTSPRIQASTESLTQQLEEPFPQLPMPPHCTANWTRESTEVQRLCKQNPLDSFESKSHKRAEWMLRLDLAAWHVLVALCDGIGRVDKKATEILTVGFQLKWIFFTHMPKLIDLDWRV